MINPMVLGSVAITALLLIFLITTIANTRKKKLSDHEQYEQELNDAISRKELILQSLNEELQNAQPNRLTNIPESLNNVLDLYEKSNIKIPIDIIEDTLYMNLNNETDILNFIESQRNHWKLENNKKLYKG